MNNNLMIFNGFMVSEEPIPLDKQGKLHIEKEIKISEVEDSLAENYVSTTYMFDKLGTKCYKYKSYIDGFIGFKTPQESLETLILSKLNISDFHVYKLKTEE